jgi:hypothetical protein
LWRRQPPPVLPYGDDFPDVEQAIAVIDEQLRVREASADRVDTDWPRIG